ncbi:unnamed protein product, partial [Clonostachys byssicola]
MAEEGAISPLVMPKTPYDDLHLNFSPESQIITEMMSNDETSPTITVDKIVALTCTLAATSSERDLNQHAVNVSHTIIAIATRVPHEKQSKLVEFCFRLQLHTIPDPINGGTLSPLGLGEGLWSEWPHLQRVADRHEWRDFYDLRKAGISQIYENYSAWRAQLSELGFSFWKQESYLSNLHLTWPFGDRRLWIGRRDSVRLMCLWFIHAPNRLWFDAHLRRRNVFLKNRQFRRFFWPLWKEFLKVCLESEVNEDKGKWFDDRWDDTEGVSEQDLSDADTQELIKRALESMEKVEADHAIRS